MFSPKGFSVKVRKMTEQHLSILRCIMRQDDIDFMNVRLHLKKSDKAYDLIWPICFKKKKGWCVNGFAYVDVQPNAFILHIREYLPVKWTEQMEYDLLKSVETELKSKDNKRPVWLAIGTLTVHAIA